MKQIDKMLFKKTCLEANSMMSACAKLNMRYTTFRKYAKLFNCFYPNQSGKGCKKHKKNSITIESILSGKHPEAQTGRVKKLLLRSGIKQNKCEVCGCDGTWLGKPITIELHHIDGNNHNHSIDNLIMMCPNCHSQTQTYRFKNKHHN